MKNAPTLLIGLGGCGSDIVTRVYNKATEEERKQIAFVIFDTDVNELNQRKEKCPFIKTVQTSTKQTVGGYLNRDTHARDSWFPVNSILNGKTLTEGAGQVRSISRLALDTVIRAGKMEPLHEAIQSLYKMESDKVEQALRVVIVSSLAGGTGSGLILPVAMYVRNYLKTHFSQSANISRGFFILPEVFYEAVVGEAERNNLKANAYATLREIDSFLMKGDHYLPKKYENSVKLEFPKSTSDGYEEYDVKPFDFCFLFDAQNTDGCKLNSHEQYRDHAATCIYAQSVGPMSFRSNSSEDNTIRKLAKERGRNRYAGAGASMIVYPVDDIKKYVALNWTKGAVSKNWLYFDSEFKNRIKENEKKREMGYAVRDITRSDFYQQRVAALSNTNAFAKSIENATNVYDPKTHRKLATKAEEFKINIDAKIKQVITQSYLAKEGQELKDNIGKLDAGDHDASAYMEQYDSLKSYFYNAQQSAEEEGQELSYAIFNDNTGANSSEQIKYRITDYIQNNGQYIHPNAIRYFLITALDVLKKSKSNASNSKEKKYKDINEFFEAEDGKDDEPSYRDLVDAKGLGKKDKKDEFKDSMITQQKNIDDLGKDGSYLLFAYQESVYESGINHITKLVEAFDNFYESLGNKVETIDRQIREIKKKYSDIKGSTVRYVCSSAACLDEALNRMPYLGSDLAIDPGLSQEIYKSIFSYAMKDDKPSNFFSKLFDENIIGYFEKNLQEKYGDEIDLDIIGAIEKEAIYEKYVLRDENEVSHINQYIAKVINEVRKLSVPFIETPMGEMGDPIHACAYNLSIAPDKNDESARAQLIRKELGNRGGSASDTIDKYRIMFYQSYYGIRANNLSKFAPPEKSLTYNRTGGEYYTAYFNLINNIHPEVTKSREISPHIDKWWHIITKMPDLDEDNQRMQEYNIYAAFFWAIINRYIYYSHETNKVSVYKLKSILLNMPDEDDSLFVSNGTPCDMLYEVLDAIAIYPNLVNKVLERVAIATKKDVDDNKQYTQGFLYKSLSNYSLVEPGLGKNKAASTSIFDIPMLMKKSATAENYQESAVIEMLRTEIEEIRRYLSNFLNENELNEKVGEIIIEQYSKHLESVAKEYEVNNSIYEESLFTKVCDVIQNYLKDCGFEEEADAIASEFKAINEKIR